MNETIQLLQKMSGGDDTAEAELYGLLYEELHGRAARLMRNQAATHTLQATALVNEAWIKLSKVGECSWQDRAHFLKTACRAMQCVLVDHARAKLAQKRGGDRAQIELQPGVASSRDPSWQLVALDEALQRLEEESPDQHRVAQLRIFGGLPHGEIAKLTGASVRTVERLWGAARGALRDAL